MKTKQKLESAHKQIAIVAGQMSLAITVKKVKRTQVNAWKIMLKHSIEILDEIK